MEYKWPESTEIYLVAFDEPKSSAYLQLRRLLPDITASQAKEILETGLPYELVTVSPVFEFAAWKQKLADYEVENLRFEIRESYRWQYQNSSTPGMPMAANYANT